MRQSRYITKQLAAGLADELWEIMPDTGEPTTIAVPPDLVLAVYTLLRKLGGSE